MGRRFRVTVDGETFIVEVEEIEGPPRVETPPPARRPVAVAHRRVEREEKAERGVVTAPMPGVVTEVKVEAGDAVEAGAPLLVLEAMKMENEIHAPFGGVVREVYVEAGQRVGRGERLILIS